MHAPLREEAEPSSAPSQIYLEQPYEIKGRIDINPHFTVEEDAGAGAALLGKLLKRSKADAQESCDGASSEVAGEIRLPNPLPSIPSKQGIEGATSADLEPDDLQKPVRGEVALWRSVILQAVTDAMSESKKPELKYERSQARVWLEGRSDDFLRVCHYAQLDPSYVRKRCRIAVARHDNKVNAGDNGEVPSI